MLKKQLFLLHFAGGNSYSYNFLKENLDKEFEFIPLELPGRGKRLKEKLITNKKKAVNDYVAQIKNLRNNKPYIIYGHSMGATLGLLVTRKMEKIGDAPTNLVVSGNAGPMRQENEIKRHLLGEIEFKDVLLKLGGVSEEVLKNKELYEFFNPIIRSDFELLENDYLEEGLLINTPIHALMGDREETVNNIENWNKFTLECFTYVILPGNHFFIYEHSDALSKIIRAII